MDITKFSKIPEEEVRDIEAQAYHTQHYSPRNWWAILWHYLCQFGVLLMVLVTLAGLITFVVQHREAEDMTGTAWGANTSTSKVGQAYRTPIRGPVLYVSRPVAIEKTLNLSNNLLGIELQPYSQSKTGLSRQKCVFYALLVLTFCAILQKCSN